MSREWNDQEIKILTVMWRDGASASQIARHLPADRTRSSVLGRVHRMGLSKSPGVMQITRRQKPCVPVRPAIVKKEEPPPEPEVELGPMNPPITTLELRDVHCKWPYDAPGGGYHYCGRGKKTGSPWCEGHHKKAYQPLKKPAA